MRWGITLLGSIPFVAAGSVAGWYFGRLDRSRLEHRREARAGKQGEGAAGPPAVGAKEYRAKADGRRRQAPGRQGV